MDRQQALALLEKHLHTGNLIKHSLASEAIMRALAEKLGYDIEQWGLAGLLHDLDYDLTKDEPLNHGRVTVDMLKDTGLDEEVLRAILAHNAEALGMERTTQLDLALTAAETMTGMVTAAALVHPERKLEPVKPKSILKRMKEKQFARGANRDHIMLCEKIGIPIADFAVLSLSAMTEIHEELGL